MRTTITIAVALIAALLTNSVYACGESLYRVGKGVAFRQYTAPIPGNIIAVANTEAEMTMVERLVAAGHDVHVVGTPGELAAEMQEHEFDIVLAYFSQRDAVERQTSASGVTYIPVALRDTPEVEQARSAYPRSLRSDDSVKHFLKTIHKTLRTRKQA